MRAGVVSVSANDPTVSADTATLSDGESVTFSSTDGKKLPSKLEVTVGGQSLNIHASCSDDLIIGQSFGSLTLTGFIPEP